MLDFCIIGAPKAGTTSLFNWLNVHPELEGATPKETYFLMDAEHPLCGTQGVSYNTHGETAYARFFNNGQRYGKRFEATTQYFYQRTARDYLASLNPQPLIIISLREPADRILSSFRYTRDNLGYCDQTLTFDHYVECLLNGNTAALDRHFQVDGSAYIAKKELQLGCYHQWLDWWLEQFDHNRLKIVLFDDLKNEPARVMDDLSRQLHINPDFYQDFSFGQDNITYPVGKRTIHRLAKPLGERLPGGPLKDYLKAKYLAWQRSKATPDNNFQVGLQQLRTYFEPANKRLAEQYNLDLAHWHQNANTQAALTTPN